MGMIQTGSLTAISMQQIQQNIASDFMGSVRSWADRLDAGVEDNQVTCQLHHSHGQDCAIGSDYEARRKQFWADERAKEVASGIRKPPRDS